MAVVKVTWSEVEIYFKKRDYKIYSLGDGQSIAEPSHPIGKLRNVVHIGRECCHTRSAEVIRPYLKQIENVFGVTVEQIKEE